MRCPKCQYISFDSGDRCRNCGYEFSLAADGKELDLPIKDRDEPLGPLADLDLRNHAGNDVDREQVLTAGAGQEHRAAVSSETPVESPLDLPLFRGGDDRPLVTPPAVPRPPLAVRRASVPIVRPRPPAYERGQTPALDLGSPEVDRATGSPAVARDAEDTGASAAPLGRRLFAAAIDVAILGAIDITILYFTLRLCGLQVSEAALVPAVPFGAFVLLLNGAYFVAFTVAAGQTIGKMAAGIRVVPFFTDDAGADRVPFGHAVLRAAAYLVSVLPAGLGFIPAVLGTEHRALHDRLADTRVVRA